jgi:hypothetical protein
MSQERPTKNTGYFIGSLLVERDARHPPHRRPQLRGGALPQRMPRIRRWPAAHIFVRSNLSDRAVYENRPRCALTKRSSMRSQNQRGSRQNWRTCRSDARPDTIPDRSRTASPMGSGRAGCRIEPRSCRHGRQPAFFASIVVAAAGEVGHTPLKRGVRSRTIPLPIAAVGSGHTGDCPAAAQSVIPRDHHGQSHASEAPGRRNPGGFEGQGARNLSTI